MSTVEVRLLRAEDVDFGRGIVDIRKSKGYGQHYAILYGFMLEIMLEYDKATDESMRIAVYIAQPLNEYAPAQMTGSTSTLRSCQNALALYMAFLENEKKNTCTSLEGSCFTRIMAEEWIIWLRKKEAADRRAATTAPLLCGHS